MEKSIQKISTVLKYSRFFTKKIFLTTFALLFFLTACGTATANQAILQDSDIAVEPAASISEEPIVVSAEEDNAPEFEMIDQAEETGDLASAFDAFSAKQEAGRGGGPQPGEADLSLAPPVSEDALPAETELLTEAPVVMLDPAEQPPIKPENGFTAPDFNLRTIEGLQVNTGSLRGKPVLLSYWTSWCVPCIEELPILEKISQEYPEMEIVSINGVEQDDLNTVRETIANLRLTHLVLLDEGEQFWKSYMVLFLPTSFFIDRYGIIRHVQFGSLSEDKIREKIEQLIFTY